MRPPAKTAGFEAYESYLNAEFGPDYWSDEGIATAEEMVSAFSEEDWIALTRSWPNHVERWRVRCAETLDIDLRGPALGILLSMLEDSCVDVVLAAAETLTAVNGALRREDIPLERIYAVKQSGSVSVGLAMSAILTRVIG